MTEDKRGRFRQNRESYDPQKDSPLIDGYDGDKSFGVYLTKGEITAFAMVKTKREMGMTRAMRMADLVELLEDAAADLPKYQTINFDSLTVTITDKEGRKVDMYKLDFYPKDEIDIWLKKWLTVPPA